MAMARRAVRIGVSLVLAAALLAWFLRGADLAAVGSELAGADTRWLAAAVGVALAGYWLRVVRWHLILRPVGSVRHANALMATLVGYAGITLLPARMGDLMRPIILSRRERLPVSASLASILTERVLDMWTVVIYLMVFVIWTPPLAESASPSLVRLMTLSGYLVGAGIVVATGVLLALLRFRERFIAVMTRPIRRLKESWQRPVAGFLKHFLDGLSIVSRPRDLLVTAASSLLLWAVIYWQLRFTLLAFGLDLPLRACFFIVAFSVIGLAIPTPGAVGGFHKTVELATGLFVAAGSSQVIKSFAIAHHAVCFVPITILGLLSLPLLGLSIGEVGREAGRISADDAPQELEAQSAEPAEPVDGAVDKQWIA
jgi:uncharacterized protein (TIRG00374 family)